MKKLTKLSMLFLAFSLSYSAAKTQTVFQERSQEAGLLFTHQEMLLMGGGAAAFDFDNDGDEDVYVSGGAGPDALFLNDGQANFSNVSLQYGIVDLTKNVVTTSVTTGDIDNDGIREIFVGTVGPTAAGGGLSKNLLLKLNATTQKFEDIANAAGLREASFCMGGHFFDANMDGLLDLYVMNYVETPGFLMENNEIVGYSHQCGRNTLYINNGGLFFSDWSVIYGLTKDGCTLAATTSDIDGDGDVDLLIANDFGKWLSPNYLYRNNYPAPSFTDISAEAGMNARMYAMGIAVGDYDEDADFDYYFTNLTNNHFFENEGNQTFLNKASQMQLEDTYAVDPNLYTTGWGTFFADVNNDSYLDLFVANGYVNSAVDHDGEHQKDRLFLGNYTHRFDERSEECGITFEGLSRGAIYADFNNDGQLDILTVTNDIIFPGTTNFLQYYENQSAEQKNWIAFRLEGRAASRDAYGAKVVVYTGFRKFVQEISGGSSHASQNTSVAHFGLNDLAKVDSVQFLWPGGSRQTMINPVLNQVHDVIQIDSIKGSNGPVITSGFGLAVQYYQLGKTLELRNQGSYLYEGDLLVSDMAGRIIQRQKVVLEPGEISFLPLPSLNNQIFVVSVRDRGGVKVRKFYGF